MLLFPRIFTLLPTRRWLTFLRACNCARVTFVPPRLIPSRSPYPRPFVEQVVKGSFNPTFDEGFTVPNCTDGICVVMRVYDDASTGVFSTLFGRGNSCLGEVLLDLTIASELEGEAVLDFPLHPIECVAPASSLTQHALFCSTSVLRSYYRATRFVWRSNVTPFALNSRYTGQLRQAQELLRNRTDKVAKEYTAEHTQDIPT